MRFACCSPAALHNTREAVNTMNAAIAPTAAPQKRKRNRKTAGLACYEAKERHEAVQSWRKLSRLVKMNFSSGAGDLFLTLSFDENIMQAEAFRRYVRFIRRLRLMYQYRQLPACKYILLKEDHNGQQHAHVFINAGLSMAELRQLWPFGALDASVIEDTTNRVELKKYMQKQHGQENGGGWTMDERRFRQRRWTTSRNLETFWK